MRRLMLLRHAKSDRAPGVDDHERPLNARGREAAPGVGEWLAQQQLFPNLVVCSTARRTRQTFELLAPSFPKATRVEFEDKLYLAERDEIIAMVRALPRGAACAMLVGHNPGLQDAAIALAGSGDTDLRRQLHGKFPTAALAIIDFPSDDWGAARPGGGRLDRYRTPKSAEAD